MPVSEDRLEYQRRYYRENRERVKQRAREYEQRTGNTKRWRAENLKLVREKNAAYMRAHPEKRAEAEARRKARKLGSVVERFTRQEIYERDGGRCHLCGKKTKFTDMHLDHLVPLSKGGDHTALNVRVAHAVCNLKRQDGRLPAQLLLA